VPPFHQWRQHLGLTRTEAAARLGYGKRKVEAWDRGEESPRLVVRLAMAAVERGIEPISEE
jgi:DNA-binding transcriptional regulator YiaG